MDREQKIRLAKVTGLVTAWAFSTASVVLLLVVRWLQIEMYLQPYVGYLSLIGGVVAGMTVLTFWLAFRVKNGVKTPRPVKAFAGFFLVTFTIVGTGCFYFGVTYIPFSRYDAGPYLTWANGQDPSTSITVSWRTYWDGESSMRYGTRPDILDQTARSTMVGQFHHVSLTGLQPNTIYYYQVQGAGVKQFKTAGVGLPVSNLTFCVWSDPRTNNDYFTALGGAEMPKFMYNDLHTAGTGTAGDTSHAFSICCGDITCRGIDKDTWRMWLEDITYKDFASNASHQVALGNHARHEDCDGSYAHIYYPYQTFNYSFTYQNIHFVMLDPWDYETCNWGKISPEQFAWAEADLKAHQDAPFKVISMHPSPINHGRFDGNIFANVSYLCCTYGVDVVFSGHNHHYEVARIDGTYYIKIGIGGNSNMGTYQERSTNVTDSGGEHLDGGGGVSGYCRVDVSKDTMWLRPRLVDGTSPRPYFIAASDN